MPEPIDYEAEALKALDLASKLEPEILKNLPHQQGNLIAMAQVYATLHQAQVQKSYH
jgi:hypothetical protein